MDVRRTVEAVWRMESATVVIGLTRLVRDVGLAEDIAQEAFASALQQWPVEGVPANPAAWLMTVGRRKAIDLIRRERARADRYAQLATDPPARLSAVLEVVYLIFNEGYSATSGDRWVRRDLADEAIRLGRRLAGLLPKEPEVHGLVALMELQASRFAARVGAQGEPVLLPDQDRSRWDRTMVAHGLAELRRAVRLRRPLGPYTVQAAISGCHARARTFAETDWEAVVALYDALAQLAPSPVVELNRAVALLHADGPQAALSALDAIRDDPRMVRYHLYGAVRGEVLQRLGRPAEAAEELERAAGLAPTRHERAMLMERAAAAATGDRPQTRAK